MDDNLLWVSLYVICTLILWQIFISIYSQFGNQHKLRNSNILVVTAHPDDECMFFGPTLIEITSPRRNNVISLLCLSRGNHDGIGNQRKLELIESAKILGISFERVFNPDHSDLHDNPKQLWNSSIVANEIDRVISSNDIDTIITFDEYGVSGHLNHISCFKGVETYISKSNHIKAFKLVSVNILRKYIFIFDLPFTLAFRGRNNQSFLSSSLLYISSPFRFFQARKAMTKHITQLVWFRYLYILFSRYMVINDLVEIQPKKLD